MKKKYPAYLIALLLAYVLMLVAALSLVTPEYLLYNWPLMILLALPAAAFVHYFHSGTEARLRLLTLLLLVWLALLYIMISAAVM
jgi:hypothetical protein